MIQHVDLGPEFFGEGITITKDRVFQLTWKSGVGFVYDLTASISCENLCIQERDGVSRRMAANFS